MFDNCEKPYDVILKENLDTFCLYYYCLITINYSSFYIWEFLATTRKKKRKEGIKFEQADLINKLK